MIASLWGAIMGLRAIGLREKRMIKFAIRLLALAILATLPVITHANAATSHSKHLKKHARTVQHAPAAQDPNKNPFSSNYGDDFDRKNAGGGGY
jgi:multisubunit Na+/H+ antiporter MnhG subunit